ncbi:unnamed protein product [Microthlaspi erraticum]|uniref:TFIIF beta subunit HTH domain-containing protein n=1 Tax=Microthlaspi erraticum TaxID=1685480 RepID=A0A6D2L0U7_9BRAS|nr:unnamed protein product [Microthlaspi erraticum]
MGKSEMQKIQRKKPQENEKNFVKAIERLIELAMEDDQMNFHELETENADQMVWLMKCPPRVVKAWRDLSSPSSSDSVPMAKYTDSVNLLLPDLSPELTMEILGAELWNVSKLYSVNKSKDFCGPMSIFSEANQGEVAVEGTVTDKLEMRPHCGIEEYGKLCQGRNRKQVAEVRHTQALENCRGLHLIPKPVMVKKKTASVKLERRSRSSRGKVEAMIMELFERQPNWTWKQLFQETNQPEEFLRGILRELCVYNGHARSYELKPEYKNTGEEDTTDAH